MSGKFGGAAVAGLAAAMFAGIAGLSTLGFADPDDDADVGDPDGPCLGADAADVDLDDEQTRIAEAIITVGQDTGVPVRGLVVALATAAVESRLRNLDHGDRDSLGVFQQRPSSGWGTPEQITDVTYSSAAFFGGSDGPNSSGAASEPPGLLDITGWKDMPVGEAAQAVQRSAFPDRYADWEDEARDWVDDLTGNRTGCDAALPIEPGRYRITDRFGMREHPITGEVKLHNGLDFAAPTGTPVTAVAGGDVTFVGFRPWAGPHVVEIDHGDGHVSVYEHMSDTGVAEGDSVTTGDPLGAVGSEGWSTGPHLHLTIRRDGEPIDPERWFAGHDIDV